MNRLDELIDLIVGGKNAEAYDLLRDEYWLISSYDEAKQNLEFRQSQPWPRLADIDIHEIERRHTEAISLDFGQRSYDAATKRWKKNAQKQRIYPGNRP